MLEKVNRRDAARKSSDDVTEPEHIKTRLKKRTVNSCNDAQGIFVFFFLNSFRSQTVLLNIYL